MKVFPFVGVVRLVDVLKSRANEIGHKPPLIQQTPDLQLIQTIHSKSNLFRLCREMK